MKTMEKNEGIFKIVSEKSQVGKYIDLNGDGCPDGVIFADLAVGGEKSDDFLGSFRIPVKSDFKDYIVTGDFEHPLNGKQEVLSPILSGNDRFYIVALEEAFDGNATFYANAFRKMKGYETETSTDFGSGKTNTINLYKKWKQEEYGEHFIEDLWGKKSIEDAIKDNWFIPSKDEMTAIFMNLNFTNKNYNKREFNPNLWTSSQANLLAMWGFRTMSFDTVKHLRVQEHETVRYLHVRLVKTI